jgi:hypothetical protein
VNTDDACNLLAGATLPEQPQSLQPGSILSIGGLLATAAKRFLIVLPVNVEWPSHEFSSLLLSHLWLCSNSLP